MKARDQLLALRKAEDPFATPAAQLDELRLEAARELFAERRQQVPLLARLASENGVSEIGQRADLVPVLFSHSSYKSYPAAFMKKGQWDRMFQWLAMVQTQSPVGIPTDGITDMDDWIARLWENGHLVNTTSATSGKTSILPRNAHDQEITRDYMLSVPGWPNPIKPDNSRHFFMFAPRRGTHSSSVMGAMVAELYGRPDSCHYLIDEMRVTDISAAAEFRLRLADGSPLAILRNWLPPRFAGFTATELESTGLYQLLAQRHGRPAVAKQRITAVPDGATEARLLGVKRNAPLISMQRTAFDASGQAVEFADNLYRADAYAIEVTVFNH